MTIKGILISQAGLKSAMIYLPLPTKATPPFEPIAGRTFSQTKNFTDGKDGSIEIDWFLLMVTPKI